MNSSYEKIMKEPIRIKVNSLVKEGTTDFRRIMNVLWREKYEVDKEVVEPIYNKIIGEIEKSKAKYARSRSILSQQKQQAAKQKVNIKLDYGGGENPLKQRMREQMRIQLARKARYKKQSFMREKCPSFRFEKGKTSYDEDKRILEYSGQSEFAVLTVKTTLTSNKIHAMELLCRRQDLSQGSVLDIVHLSKISNEEQRTALLQRWLKNTVNQMKLNNVQEVIWYVATIISDKFGLQPEIAAYLKRNLAPHILSLDVKLEKMLIEKALEQI